jgi:hypothetical protein
MSRRTGGPPRPRDIAKEQALVREKWQLVHANIKVDDAMKAFLTETLDTGGVTIAFGAFDLVRQVLNPKGYVRLDHKAELSNIGAVVRHPESAWAQQGKNIGNKWDFTDSWWLNNPNWNSVDNYKLLSLDAVDSFCECTSKTRIDRTSNATYKDTTDDLDDEYSLSVVDSRNKYIDVITELPGETHNEEAVLRWQTKYCDAIGSSMLGNYLTNTANTYKYLQENQKSLEPYWRLALRINRWGKQNEAEDQQAEEDDHVEEEQEQEDAQVEAPVVAPALVVAPAAENSEGVENDIGKILLSSVHAEEQQICEDEETALGFTEDKANVLTTAGKHHGSSDTRNIRQNKKLDFRH